MKLVLSPIINVDEFLEKELVSEESKLNKLYSKEKWTWFINTVICKYGYISDADRFLQKFILRDTVERYIFNLHWIFDLSELDYWEALHNLWFPYIDIQTQYFSFRNLANILDTDLLVYLRPCQFKIKTNNGLYLVEPISSNIVIRLNN